MSDLKNTKIAFIETVASHMNMSPEYISGILSVASCVHIQWNAQNVIGDYVKDLSIEGLISLAYYNGGSYFTKLPISSKEYRKFNPTKADVKYIEDSLCFGKKIVAVLFIDDWGEKSAVIYKDYTGKYLEAFDKIKEEIEKYE